MTPPLLCPACGKALTQWSDMTENLAMVECQNLDCPREPHTFVGQGPTHAAALEDLRRKIKTPQPKPDL
jgi:hypothetical protein